MGVTLLPFLFSVTVAGLDQSGTVEVPLGTTLAALKSVDAVEPVAMFRVPAVKILPVLVTTLEK